MRVPKRSVIFSGSMIESGALTETVLVMRVAARIFESFMTLRARRTVMYSVASSQSSKE